MGEEQAPFRVLVCASEACMNDASKLASYVNNVIDPLVSPILLGDMHVEKAGRKVLEARFVDARAARQQAASGSLWGAQAIVCLIAGDADRDIFAVIETVHDLTSGDALPELIAWSRSEIIDPAHSALLGLHGLACAPYESLEEVKLSLLVKLARLGVLREVNGRLRRSLGKEGAPLLARPRAALAQGSDARGGDPHAWDRVVILRGQPVVDLEAVRALCSWLTAAHEEGCDSFLVFLEYLDHLSATSALGERLRQAISLFWTGKIGQAVKLLGDGQTTRDIQSAEEELRSASASRASALGRLGACVDEDLVHALVLRSLPRDLPEVASRMESVLTEAASCEARHGRGILAQLFLGGFLVKERHPFEAIPYLEAAVPSPFLPAPELSDYEVNRRIEALFELTAARTATEDVRGAAKALDAIADTLRTQRPEWKSDLFIALKVKDTYCAENGLEDEDAAADSDARDLMRSVAAEAPEVSSDDPAEVSKAALQLCDQGWDLREEGDFAGACAAFERGIALYRTIAGTGNDDYDESLACALSNYGMTCVLSACGRVEAGERALRESAELRRARLPEGLLRIGKNHVNTLHQLALSLMGHGESNEAIALEREAVDVARSLCEHAPGTYEDMLLSRLLSLADALSVPEPGEATKLYDEAIGRAQAALDAGNEAMARTLADVHHNAGCHFYRDGTEHDLDRATSEHIAARGLYERLCEGSSDVSPRESLSRCLQNLAIDLSRAEDLPHALEAQLNAVEVARDLVSRDAPRYESTLARRLKFLADLQRQLDMRPDAAKAYVETAELMHRTGASAEEEATTWWWAAVCLSDEWLSDKEDAWRRALGIYKRVDDASSIANCTKGLANALREQERWEEAADTYLEASSAAKRAAFAKEKVAELLWWRAVCCGKAGDRDAECAAYREAEALYREAGDEKSADNMVRLRTRAAGAS